MTKPNVLRSRIYVASSWRNSHLHDEVVSKLKEAGFEVYDYRHPEPGNNGFSWSSIDPNWRNWTFEEYRAALKHSIAERAFGLDQNALEGCHALVLLPGAGRSAYMEAGFAAGAGKRCFVLWADGLEPELMIKMCTCEEGWLFGSVPELVSAVKAWGAP